MIEMELTSRPPRTRPYTWPEVLRAIGHAHSRPGNQQLVEAERIRNCHSSHAAMVAAELELEDRQLAGILGWAQVMDPVPAISLIGSLSESVYLMITGVLPGGPTISVVSWVDDVPLQVRAYISRRITVAELHALADGTGTVPVDALVGGR